MMSAHPASRFQGKNTPLWITPPAKQRFDAIKLQLETDKHRQVSQSELIEMLLDKWEAGR